MNHHCATCNNYLAGNEKGARVVLDYRLCPQCVVRVQDFLIEMARDIEEYNLNLKLVDRALNTEPD